MAELFTVILVVGTALIVMLINDADQEREKNKHNNRRGE